MTREPAWQPRFCPSCRHGRFELEARTEQREQSSAGVLGPAVPTDPPKQVVRVQRLRCADCRAILVQFEEGT